MLNKAYIGVLVIGLLSGPTVVLAQEEMFTLFTTQQEREIIDANRYKNDQQETLEPQVQTAPSVENTDQKEEEKLSFLLSGFTLTQSGQNVAWINGKPYENGSKLDDGSTLIIRKKKDLNVQIKTPDGKYHTLTTGKTEDIGYYKPQIEG